MFRLIDSNGYLPPYIWSFTRASCCPALLNIPYVFPVDVLSTRGLYLSHTWTFLCSPLFRWLIVYLSPFSHWYTLTNLMRLYLFLSRWCFSSIVLTRCLAVLAFPWYKLLPDSLIQTTNVIHKLNLINRLLIYKLLMSIKIEIRGPSPRCIFPRRE